VNSKQKMTKMTLAGVHRHELKARRMQGAGEPAVVVKGKVVGGGSGCCEVWCDGW
jgi:hypothetical protein